MAKKRRKQEEEEEEFKLPEFDEGAFLRKEITGAKVMFVMILLAVVAAAVSYFLTLAGIVIVAFFAGLCFVFLARYLLPLVKIDTTGFERKDWLGQGTTFFFTWLAIWVLMMNVPFADVTLPSLTVYVNGQQVVPGESYSADDKGWAMVTARATDNAGISGVWIAQDGGSALAMSLQPDGTLWSYNVTMAGSNRSITITAEDINGNPPVSVQFIITP